MVKAAKKRKKEEDDSFDLPEFDEVAYMSKEMEAAKASFVLLALAVAVAALLFAITIGGAPIVGFFLALGITIFLPRVFEFLPWPKVDVRKFERRDWFSHRGVFFFSWLAFWILFLNVPFMDVTSPTIASVSVNDTTIKGGGEQNNLSTTPPIYLNATVFDNAQVVRVELVLTNATSPFQFVPSGGLRWSLGLVGSTFDNAVIVATDSAGRSSEFLFDLILS